MGNVRLFATPWTAAHQASLSLTISQSLPKFISIALVMPSSHLTVWCPLLLLPSIFPSIKERHDFSHQSAVRIRWPRILEFQFQHQSFQWVSIQGWFLLRMTGLIPLVFKGLSEVCSSIRVQRHKFLGILPSWWSSSYNCTRPLGRPWPDYVYGPLSSE